MNPQFWQITAGQISTGLCWLAGALGSAWIFTWKMGQMHGQNLAKIDGLTSAVKALAELVTHHAAEIQELKSLAHSSQERLRLLEQEARDNREHNKHLY